MLNTLILLHSEYKEVEYFSQGNLSKKSLPFFLASSLELVKCDFLVGSFYWQQFRLQLFQLVAEIQQKFNLVIKLDHLKWMDSTLNLGSHQTSLLYLRNSRAELLLYPLVHRAEQIQRRGNLWKSQMYEEPEKVHIEICLELSFKSFFLELLLGSISFIEILWN